jgi:CRISPR system Cascade subunit CasB
MQNIHTKADAFPDAAVFAWWLEMQPASEKPGQPNRRGELAELKHCKSLEDILLVPRFQLLRRILQVTGRGHLPACAAMAGILAHIKTHQDKPTFAAWLAQPRGESAGSRVSELRFRRLIRIKSHDELFIDLVRVLPLADNTAPVVALARDVYRWNDFTRQRWTFDYYDALGENQA